MTTHFTFFASYYDSVERLDSATKGEFFDVLFKYALRDEIPSDDVSAVVLALFTMAKPNLDKSKAKRENGQAGGKQNRSKPKANGKQNGSKPKQTESDKEKEKGKGIGDSKGTRLENLPNESKKLLHLQMIDYCKDNGIDAIEIDKFTDYWKSQSGANAVKKDWIATFRNWCRSDWVKKVDTQSEVVRYV